MTYPEIVCSAVRRIKSGEALHSAVGWVWTMGRSDDRLSVDDWIVQHKHPLGQLPGTREQRFKLLVIEAIELDNGKESA